MAASQPFSVPLAGGLNKSTNSFDLLKKGWPEKHISVLKETGLIGKKYSPIILENRKIS